MGSGLHTVSRYAAIATRYDLCIDRCFASLSQLYRKVGVLFRDSVVKVTCGRSLKGKRVFIVIFGSSTVRFWVTRNSS